MPSLLQQPTNIIAAGLVVFKIKKIDSIPDIVVIVKNKCHQLPKGKCECRENIAVCALRETQEETGLSQLLIAGSLGHTIHHYWQENTYYKKITLWYAAALQGTEKKLKPQELENISEAYWLPAPDAITSLTYPNQQQLIKELLKLIEK